MKKIEMNELDVEQKHSMHVRIISALIMLLVSVPCIVLGGWFFLVFAVLVLATATFEFIHAPHKTNKYSPFVYTFIYILTFMLTFWSAIKNNMNNINNPASIFNEWSFNGTFVVFDSVGEATTSIMLSTIGISVLLLVLFFLSIIHSNFNIQDVTYLFTMVILISIGTQSLLFLRYYPEACFLTQSTVYNFNKISTCTLFAYIILATIMTDTGAYFTGILFGKHKMNPRISPKKTWEGFFGGIIISAICSITFAVVMSLVGYPILPCLDIKDSFSWVYIILFGLTMPLVATLGDFIFSAIKRHFDIKDFSNIIKGHGGILDRLDSIFAVGIYVASVLVLIGNSWSFLK